MARDVLRARSSADSPIEFANRWMDAAFERHVATFLSHGAVAGALLLLGVAYYLCFRTELPPALEFLRAGPLALEPATRLASLPSLIHVTAFGVLTFAFLRPGLPSAFAAGTIWAGINVAWEFSCAHQQAWLRAGGELMGRRYQPTCTYDAMDIAASVAGAAATVGIAWCILKIHPVRPSISQE